MSTLSFATPDGLLGWLKKLAGAQRFVAPRQEGPVVLFRPYAAEDINDVDAMLRRSASSSKDTVMPKSEVLVRFRSTKDPDDPAKLDLGLEAPQEAEPTVVFGGRPCDARGFVVLDRPFTGGKYKDPYYMARREAMTVITQACPTSYTGCFCTWVGSNPADREGSDVLFTKVDGGFVLEAVSPKGETLLADAGFEPAGEREAAAKAVQDGAAATLPPESEIKDVPERLAARFTDTAFWDKEASKCLGCGACTYLCPTCQCFNITDEGNILDGRRVRTWDSCMKAQFTLEASGHNPRGDKGKRWRQRAGHKFSYYPSTYDGNYSCVGCGRCITNCPVSLDIRNLVELAVGGVQNVAAFPVPGPAAKGSSSAKAAPDTSTAVAGAKPESAPSAKSEAPKAAPAKNAASVSKGGVAGKTAKKSGAKSAKKS